LLAIRTGGERRTITSELEKLALYVGSAQREATVEDVALLVPMTAEAVIFELGNALAVVGGGREDFNEVIRQLSQLGAVGKVTKENLDPIIERIPQIAAIIKEKFGAEALGDPAKTFEKLGISSQQFIKIITDELAKGERAGNTYKNSWKNIQDAATNAAAEFGKTLLPIAQRVLDEFLTPGIEKAKALATAFRDLPQPTQDWAISLTAVATAAPLVIVALGTLVEKGALLTQATLKMIAAGGSALAWLKAFAGGLSIAGLAAGSSFNSRLKMRLKIVHYATSFSVSSGVPNILDGISDATGNI
jgi:tape measure domain-containing protein